MVPDTFFLKEKALKSRIYNHGDLFFGCVSRGANTMKKTFLFSIMIFVLLFSQIGGVVAEEIPSDWAVYEVDQAQALDLVTNQVMTGFQDSITREAFAELIMKMYDRMSGQTVNVPSNNVFVDTNNPEVLRANALGIVYGVGDNRFNPHANIKRQEIAVMFYRALELIDGQHVNQDARSDFSVLFGFVDAHVVDDWARQAVVYMYNQEIIGGIGNNRLDPLGNTTKEQAIALVYRTYLRFSNEIRLGISIEQLEAILGEATDVVESEYGFDWYLYAEDYGRYIQVGVEESSVVALYTGSSVYTFAQEFIGSQKAEIRKSFGEPEEYILKGRTRYYHSSRDSVDHYELDRGYVRIFYDVHKDNNANGVLLIEKNTELGLDGFHGDLNEEVRRGYELQLFHLVNAARKNEGKTILEWDDQAARAAYLHSEDMAEQNYFSHASLDGSDLLDRLQAQGIQPRAAAENLAANQNAIFSHNGLLNSWGHRVNIFSDTSRLGVGTYLIDSGAYRIYHTQNFYK